MLLWREMEHEVGDSGLEPSRLPHLRVLQQFCVVGGFLARGGGLRLRRLSTVS